MTCRDVSRPLLILVNCLLPYFGLCSSVLCDETLPRNIAQSRKVAGEDSAEDFDGIFGYQSEVVSGEYILVYDKFRTQVDRHNDVAAALVEIASVSWSFGERTQATSALFSDFDVLKLCGSVDAAVAVLKKKTFVKSITPEKRLTRTLRFVGRTAAASGPQENAENGASNGRIVGGRKLLRVPPAPKQITYVLRADFLWAMGHKGKGVKVAVFDTGLPENHPHFKNVKDRTDWTDEKTEHDAVGHGTFVAGVISSAGDCLGFAPESDLFIFRVFTNNQVSYTSWFLDAFNYAILKKIDVLNLSIGGPDFMDQPFVDKVWELTANNVILVSAIGNDGPLYGTLNNPGDQMDVIGVGGINFVEEVAKFSSRGMTTWELPGGYGRMKPDIVTYGSNVWASSLSGACRALSGTSVASPVVAGAVALLASSVKDKLKINPGIMKQALLAGAKRILSSANMFEQGHGKLDLVRSFQILQSYTPQASLSPHYVDLTECPYMWPYCVQPIFHTGMPIILNITVLNGMDVRGRISKSPTWHPYIQENGEYLRLNFAYSEVLWPWSGYLAIILSVDEQAADFDGVVSGHVSLSVESNVTRDDGSSQTLVSSLRLPIKVRIAPTPPRNKRILWDQFHNIGYPPGYFPRDNLRMKQDPLDWNGDHPHTNFRDLFEHLRAAGYYLDVLGCPFTCFNAEHYAALLIIDPEEEYFPAEIQKLRRDVDELGLHVIVFADWYNTSVMTKLKFFDVNTRHWWQPETGGANIPAINDLLSPWNITLSAKILEGDFNIGDHKMYYASGTSILRFPSNGLVLSTDLKNQADDVLFDDASPVRNVPVLGLLRNALGAATNDSLFAERGGGVAVYGDSNCLDSAHMRTNCFWLLDALLDYFLHGHLDGAIESMAVPSDFLDQSLFELPARPKKYTLPKYSKVIEAGTSNGLLTYRSLPDCPSWLNAIVIPLNQSSPENFHKHYKLLSIDTGDLPELILPPLPSDAWDREIKPVVDFDAWQTRFHSLHHNAGFAALILNYAGSVTLSGLMVCVVFLALIWFAWRTLYRNRRRKRRKTGSSSALRSS